MVEGQDELGASRSNRRRRRPSEPPQEAAQELSTLAFGSAPVPEALHEPPEPTDPEEPGYGPL